jgi:hypothetical protein
MLAQTGRLKVGRACPLCPGIRQGGRLPRAGMALVAISAIILKTMKQVGEERRADRSGGPRAIGTATDRCQTDDPAGRSPRQRKIIHVDMDPFFA